MQMKKIVLTGGGTAGHATPNIAMIPRLQELGYEISYIGSYTGIEKALIADYKDVAYYGISSGKFRRYFSLKNLTDPFRVLKGIGDARKLLRKIKPDIVFSKGGFVAVPVVRAAHDMKIPVLIHESDMTPGLANKLCIPLARKICCTFPETLDSLPPTKAVLTGTPIREGLHHGTREAGLAFTKFSGTRPIIMVIGGSLGATPVNDAVRKALPELLPKADVVHLCGKGKVDDSLQGLKGYRQYEYIKKELPDLFAMADVVISRAGANAICELLSLRKPSLLIPLSSHASRGDQILNAKSFEKQGFSVVLEEEQITTELLVKTLVDLYHHRKKYIDAMEASPVTDSVTKITNLIEETVAAAHSD
jgi:UDP-N-acetylglucosamine--N-acetylmuramyl-(pentapeptide) pyrophosphoryl-undecaprenol N-acetylglucosamine transferase